MPNALGPSLTWSSSRTLIRAGGNVVARAALTDTLGAGARSLDILVHRLRRKLGEGGCVEPRILLTVHRVGYRLGVDVHADLGSLR